MTCPGFLVRRSGNSRRPVASWLPALLLAGVTACASSPHRKPTIILPDSTESGDQGVLLERHAHHVAPAFVNKLKQEDPEAATRLERLAIHGISYVSDDLAIRGFTVAPAAGSSPLPVIIYSRGGNGNYGAINDDQLTKWLAPIADMGYLVVASQYRGAGGSEGFDTFGGDDVHDVVNVLGILDQLPRADSSRVGIYGNSRGGMMALLALAQTDRFSAAVIDSAVSDSIDWLAERPTMESVFVERIPGYQDDPSRALYQRSPARWVERLADTPILILHGEADQRVPYQQAVKLADALKRAGRTVKLELYPGATHGLPEVKAEFMVELHDWFQRYL